MWKAWAKRLTSLLISLHAWKTLERYPSEQGGGNQELLNFLSDLLWAGENHAWNIEGGMQSTEVQVIWSLWLVCKMSDQMPCVWNSQDCVVVEQILLKILRAW